AREKPAGQNGAAPSRGRAGAGARRPRRRLAASGAGLLPRAAGRRGQLRGLVLGAAVAGARGRRGGCRRGAQRGQDRAVLGWPRVGRPTTSAASAWPRLLPRPKDEHRLQDFLARQRVPSLEDALRSAADRDRRAELRLLLEARADPNAAADTGAYGVGFTQVGAYALHLAAKRSRVAVLDILLDARAMVDAADQNGRTGLMVASASGQARAARWLLQHGAAMEVHAHDGGNTALHYAANLPQVTLVELLLEARASPNSTDRQGRAPLHLALTALPRRVEKEESTSCDPSGYGDEYCYCRDTSGGYGQGGSAQDSNVRGAVQALLRHGADPGLRDDRGRDAADILDAKGRRDALAWLAGPAGPGPDAAAAAPGVGPRGGGGGARPPPPRAAGRARLPRAAAAGCCSAGCWGGILPRARQG
ncbi:unnamed protein product, partial [Prorocentrum cordatum]